MSAAKNSSSLSNNSADAHEEELFTWLQYPVDDAFDRNYCSEFLGGLLSLPQNAVAAKAHSDTHPPARCFPDVGISTCTGSSGSSKVPLKKNVGSKLFARPSSNADNALALGAARAVGQSSQVGHDAFNRVRTSMHPLATTATPCAPLKAFDHKDRAALKPKIPTPCASKSSQGGVEIPSLHMANSFSVEKTKHAASKSTSPAAEKSRKIRETHSQQLPHAQQSRSSRITDEDSIGRVCGKYTSSHGSTAPLLGNVKMQGAITTSSNSWGVKGKLAQTDQTSETLPSYSGGSQTSMSLSFKEVMYSGKRKHEDSELWSEDVDDKARNAKAQCKSSSRRNRVSEVHNLSERNRRNRINEKLKALQDLIPNSSKTDKASVLDEAIEYMKTLQIQLQMVSMRSSMNMAPMMVPMAFPPTPMHMAPLHSIGLGVPIGHAGIGMGLGMGLNMDMGLPPQSGRAAPFQSGPAAMIQYGVPLESGNVASLHNNSQTCTNVGFLHTYPSASMQKIYEPFEHAHLRSLSTPHAHNCQQREEGQHLGYLHEHEQQDGLSD